MRISKGLSLVFFILTLLFLTIYLILNNSFEIKLADKERVNLTKNRIESTVTYVLQDERTGKPLQNTPYRLSFHNQIITDAPKNTEKASNSIIHGVTDKNGQTEVIKITGEPEILYDLLRIVGKGNYGDFFIFKEPITQKPLVNIKYVVTFCNGRIWEGYLDKYGHTAYFLNEAPCTLNVKIIQTDIEI